MSTDTNTVTSFKPWGPQADALQSLYGQTGNVYGDVTKQGYQGFDPASLLGLNTMQNIASGPNALVAGAEGAVKGVESGNNSIGTGGMFGDIYGGPGVGTNQFNSLYQNPGINNANQYQSLFQNQPTADYFGQSYKQAQQPGTLDQGIYGNIARGGLLSAYPTYNPSTGGTTGGVGQSADGTSPDGSAMSGQTSPGGSPGDPRLNGVPPPAVDPNPYRSQALQDALSNAANATKAGISAAGRYGSSAYGDAMGKALGQTATNFNLNAYNSDMDRMMQAAQAQDQSSIAHQQLAQQAAQGIGNIQEQNQANKLQAAQGISNVEGQNAQMKLSAANSAANAQNQNIQNQLAAAQGLTGVQGQNISNQLQAAGMAPQMNDLRYADANKLLQVGAAKQQEAQAKQNFGWQQLQNESGLYGNLPGTAGSGSSQTSTSQPWWQTLLGGVGALGGLAGLFGL